MRIEINPRSLYCEIFIFKKKIKMCDVLYG